MRVFPGVWAFNGWRLLGDRFFRPAGGNYLATIENQKIIYKKIIEINNYLKNINRIKWSVVDETKQTAPYEKGGTGGKNLKFKNLKTQEIFTLEQLLSYTKIQLNLLGLTKVYNPDLKEWYIKTLPNKILIDNLG